MDSLSLFGDFRVTQSGVSVSIVSSLVPEIGI